MGYPTDDDFEEARRRRAPPRPLVDSIAGALPDGHPLRRQREIGDRLKIYLASSWRNRAFDDVLDLLRGRGHEVYDFKRQSAAFAWGQVGLPERVTPAELRRGLATPQAAAGFAGDFEALERCDACVLLLPCGKSAHLEVGFAAGLRKRTFVLLEDEGNEPELMYLLLSGVYGVSEIGLMIAALEAPSR